MPRCCVQGDDATKWTFSVSIRPACGGGSGHREAAFGVFCRAKGLQEQIDEPDNSLLPAWSAVMKAA